MSHTTVIDEYTFIHNGDYSGDIKIVGPKKADNGEHTTELHVPMVVLEQFIAGKVQTELIATVENLDLSRPSHRQALERAYNNVSTLFRIAGR